MNKHLGWVVRLLIAAVGVGYILYSLNWSDRVYLPAGYQISEGIDGGADGRAFPVLRETDEAYLIKPPSDSAGHGPDAATIAKTDLTTDGSGPRLEPSVGTAIGRADTAVLLGGLGVFVPVFFVGALRWTVLMRARGIDASYWRAYRLTMAGLFFNLCMPGTTGGDVMKAFYAAKGTRQRADAVVSIGIDRVCGLVGLMLLVALVGLLSFDDPVIRKLTIGMWAALGATLLTALLYTNATIRSGLRPRGRLVNLPGLGLVRKLDALVTAYRHHKRALCAAVLLSLPIHVCLALSMALAGYALGIDRPLLYLLGTIPIVLLLWSLPVSGPLGLGPMDIVAVQLLASAEQATTQQVLLMFVVYRLYSVAVGLAGAVTLFGKEPLSPSAARAGQIDDEQDQPNEVITA